MTYFSAIGKPCIVTDKDPDYWELEDLDNAGVILLEEGANFHGFKMPRRFYGTAGMLFSAYALYQNSNGVGVRGEIYTEENFSQKGVKRGVKNTIIAEKPIFCGDIFWGRTIVEASGSLDEATGLWVIKVTLSGESPDLGVIKTPGLTPPKNDYATEITAIGDSLKKIASSLSDFNDILAQLPLSYLSAGPGSPITAGPGTPILLQNMQAKIADITKEASDRAEKLAKKEVD